MSIHRVSSRWCPHTSANLHIRWRFRRSLSRVSKHLSTIPHTKPCAIYPLLCTHTHYRPEKSLSHQDSRFLTQIHVVQLVFRGNLTSSSHASHVQIIQITCRIASWESISAQAAAHHRADSATFDISRLTDFSEHVALNTSAFLQTPLVCEPGRLLVTNARLYFQPLHDVAGDTPVRRCACFYPLEGVRGIMVD